MIFNPYTISESINLYNSTSVFDSVVLFIGNFKQIVFCLVLLVYDTRVYLLHGTLITLIIKHRVLGLNTTIRKMLPSVTWSKVSSTVMPLRVLW